MATKKRMGRTKAKTDVKPLTLERGKAKKQALILDSVSSLVDAVQEIKKITGTTEKAAPPQPGASRIVYVHGIGNKPIASVLKCQWDTALFGFVSESEAVLSYWVNRERYPNPESGTCNTSDLSDGAASWRQSFPGWPL